MSQKIKSNILGWMLAFLGIFSVLSCASKILDYKNVKKLEENVEYEKLIQVTEISDEEEDKAKLKKDRESKGKDASRGDGETVQKAPVAGPSKAKPQQGRKVIVKPTLKQTEDVKQDVVQLQPHVEAGEDSKSQKRLPEYEDSEGFVGRRPMRDPFRVGERIRFSVSYFRMTAGFMDLKVMPFVEVNGEKSYFFEVEMKTSDFFSRIYTVNDVAQTFIDFNTLLPYNLTMKIRETNQVKEVRSVFNHNDLSASYWSKRVGKDGNEKEKKVKWEIEPFSQNVVSALYYLRAFHLSPGKKLQFRVADDGKNFMFTGEVIRKESLKTDVGVLQTVVVKPQITVNGIFKQMGDILIWLTDDERKFPVRIESQIKIGTLVAKLHSIEKGQP